MSNNEKEINIKIFENSEYGKFKIILNNNEIYFVGSDICNCLGLSDVSMSLRNLDNDEKMIQTLFVSGQNRDVLTITESGLYSLILRSRKPEAKKFKKWITSEVLPSIRKTGQYSVPKDEIEIAKQLIEYTQKYIETKQQLKIRKIINRKKNERISY